MAVGGFILGVAMIGQIMMPENMNIPTDPLFNQKPAPFIAPGRLFSIEVPNGWGVALHDNDPYTIDFKALGKQGNGILQVRRIVVPKGAHPRQLVLNAIETRLKKLPNFRVNNRRDVKIASRIGAAVVGSYSYQGNLQYPVAVEEVHVVVGSEAFIFHFECFQPAAPRLAPDVNALYLSFQPRPPGTSESPFAAPDQEGGEQDPETQKLDNIRF